MYSFEKQLPQVLIPRLSWVVRFMPYRVPVNLCVDSQPEMASRRAERPVVDMAILQVGLYVLIHHCRKVGATVDFF